MDILTNVKNQIFISVCVLLAFAFKLLYIFAVYYNAKSRKSSKLNWYAGAAMLFPIITGVVCLFNQKNIDNKKEFKKSVIVFLISVVTLVLSFLCFLAVDTDRYFDEKGNGYTNLYEVTFYDKEGNTYNYDFDKKGYDYLFINGTEEKLPTSLCFVDDDGMLYYDKEMNILVKDDTCCMDENGKKYYPVSQVRYDKDGNMSYMCSSVYYDRLGNCYPYERVPYFDREGNKYGYHFDSKLTKGIYTNLTTGEQFDNDDSFVDEEGYFVHDSEHTFVKLENAKYKCQYSDKDGNVYYSASSICWKENGVMYDYYDNIIK